MATFLTQADTQLACASSRRHAPHKLGQRSGVRIQVQGGGNDAETALVPASAPRLFHHVLTEMSQAMSSP